MYKQLTIILLSIFALFACQKEKNNSSTPIDVFVKLDLPYLQKTKATGDILTNGAIVTVSDVICFFYNETQGYILKTVKFNTSGNNGAVGTIAQLNSGYKITDVPATANRVVIVGNTAAYNNFIPSSEVINHIFDYNFNIDKIDPLNPSTNVLISKPVVITEINSSASNKPNWGTISNQMKPKEKYAECNILPGFAMIQILGISTNQAPQNKITGFDLKGIYINNVYPSFSIASVVGNNATTSVTPNGTGTKMHAKGELNTMLSASVNNTIYTNNLRGKTYDVFSPALQAQWYTDPNTLQQWPQVTPANNKAFRYILPPDNQTWVKTATNKDVLQIILEINNIQPANLVDNPTKNRYVTVRGLLDQSGNPIRIQPGYVYTLNAADLMFSIDHLTETAQTEGSVGMYVQCSVQAYQVRAVDPIIYSPFE